MLGHISRDKDYVLKNSVEKISRETAKKFKGTHVVLKSMRNYRVVIKKKPAAMGRGRVLSLNSTPSLREVLDFSLLNTSIHNDLKKRDFTVNAIAWSRETGIIDPLSGIKDLKNQVIKAVRIKNLTDDPLRIIRAYRIGAELGFRIENNTKKNLKRLAKDISHVASERITDELFKILSNYNSIKYLLECYKDKVLNNIIVPGKLKKDKILANNIKDYKKFDLFLKKQLTGINKSLEGKKITSFLNKEISQGLNRLGLIRLSFLLRNSIDPHNRLKISNNIHRALKDIHNAYKEIVKTSPVNFKKNSQEAVYKIFNKARNRAFETSIILSFKKRKNIKWFFKKAEEFTKIKNKILLNGNDVQKILNIKPGAKIGKILSDLKHQQLKGSVKTKAEARRWLMSNYT